MKIGTRKSRQDNKKWKYLPETVQVRVMQFEVSILHAYRVWKLTRLCMSYRTSGQLRSSAKSHSSNYAVYMRSMMLYSGPWLTSAVSSVLFSLVLFCGKLWAITTIGLCDNCNLVKPSNLCYESEWIHTYKARIIHTSFTSLHTPSRTLFSSSVNVFQLSTFFNHCSKYCFIRISTVLASMGPLSVRIVVYELSMLGSWNNIRVTSWLGPYSKVQTILKHRRAYQMAPPKLSDCSSYRHHSIALTQCTICWCLAAFVSVSKILINGICLVCNISSPLRQRRDHDCGNRFRSLYSPPLCGMTPMLKVRLACPFYNHLDLSSVAYHVSDSI